MWLLGGNDAAVGASGNALGEVWSTTDGITWTQETATAGWTRYNHTSASTGYRMWVMGGYANSTTMNDVWYSEDGLDWIEVVSSAAWDERMKFNSVVYDEKLWIMGGIELLTRKDSVWYTD